VFLEIEQSALEAELIFRWWIHPPVSGMASLKSEIEGLRIFRPGFFVDVQAALGGVSEAKAALSEKRTAGIWMEERRSLSDTHAWMAPFLARISQFVNSDGFIALVYGDGASRAVAFRLEHERVESWRFVDATGNQVATDWSHHAAALQECIPDAPYQVHLVGKLPLVPLCGRSFGLALAVASFFRARPEFDRQALVATGAIENGRLLPVAGCRSKRQMAHRQGARLFVCPKNPEGELEALDGIETLEIEAGTLIEHALETIKGKLEELGLLRVDLRKIPGLIREILARGGTGAGDPQRTIPRLRDLILEIESALKHSSNAAAANRLLGPLNSAKLHLASLYNHSGNPKESQRVLDELLQPPRGFAARTREGQHLDVISKCTEIARRIVALAGRVLNKRLNQPRGFAAWTREGQHLDLISKCREAARRIVALADEGQFEEAGLVGERALNFAEQLASQTNDEAKRARMEVFGALGADLLLQKSVRNKDKSVANRALDLLDQNLSLSEDLEQANLADFHGQRNLTKSQVRRILWHAFWSPQSVEEMTTKLIAEWNGYPDSQGSLPYLERVRFLAAYRLLLEGGDPGFPGTDERQFRRTPGPGEEWVAATCLKYRGALMAVAGREQEAFDHFKKGLQLLSGDKPRVLRLLRFSIAGEAFRSVPKALEEWRSVLELDRMVAVEYLEAFRESRALASRIRSLRLNSEDCTEAKESLREFQLGFVY
jgi:tetratricopeptide (TPR) repeat protein